MKFKHLLICPVFVLSACGGGSSFNTTPLTNLGFATSEAQDMPDDIVATAPQALRFVEVDGENAIFERQDVIITFSDEDNFATVEIDGRTFELPINPADEDEFLFEDGLNRVSLDLFDASNGAVASYLYIFVDGYFNEGDVIWGFDTNPATVQATTGTATFDGYLSASLRRPDASAFGEGDVQLTADFDRGLVSGTARIEQNGPVTNLSFDPIDLQLDSTLIDENSFEGEVSVVGGDLGGVLVLSGYEGRFFGTETETVSGQIYGEIDIDGSPDNTFVHGYFLADQPGE